MRKRWWFRPICKHCPSRILVSLLLRKVHEVYSITQRQWITAQVTGYSNVELNWIVATAMGRRVTTVPSVNTSVRKASRTNYDETMVS